MKRIASLVSWVALVVSIIVIIVVIAGHWSGPQVASIGNSSGAAAAATPATATGAFPVGQPVQIRFNVDDPLLDELTLREQADQGRDWLLWSVASELISDTDQLSRTFFDVPAIRHSYLRQVARFEYGRTRSCLLESGDVLVLVPKAGADQRADDLAHAADEHRKNLGRIPNAIHVFEYELDGLKSGTITRIESIPGAKLYSLEYGYQEITVSSAGELEDFMLKTGDLVSATIEQDRIRLGGRKLRTGYRNIGLTEVAAIWQSEDDVQQKFEGLENKAKEFEARWQSKFDSFNAKWRGVEDTYSNRAVRDRELEDLKRRYDAASSEFGERLQAESKEIRLVDGSGFSLDPTYDYAGLVTALAKPSFLDVLQSGGFSRDQAKVLAAVFEANSASAPQNSGFTLGDALANAGISAQRLVSVIEALSDDTPEPFLKLIDDLKKAQAPADEMRSLLAKILEAFARKFRFQVARYDGPIQGTEVGMVLFYTDLIAKIWAIDYQSNTPSQAIADFEPMTRVAFSPAYDAETNELRSTRLWFGPEDRGYEVVSRAELLFARNATRIYAASSNPLEPGKEEPANAESEAFLGWWNDHYEDVARHEPEYQRLNEIMKWSLLISWLNEADRGSLLHFLKPIKVDRSAWFPDWVMNSNQLRFASWDKVSFYPRGHLKTQTEAMAILYSAPYYSRGLTPEKGGLANILSGGVSLASKAEFRARVALPTEMPVALRRSGLNYSKISGNGDELVTFRGSRFNFGLREHKTAVARPQPAIVRMTGPEKAKFRGRFGDLGEGRFSRSVGKIDTGTSIKLETAGADVGSLTISRSRNGYQVGWRAREVDDAFTLGRKLSIAEDPVSLLTSDPSVRFAVRDPQSGEFYVQTAGSRRWMKFAPEERPRPDLAEGWSARIADLKPNAKTYQLKWLEAEAFPERLRTGGKWARGPPPPNGPKPPHTAHFPEFPWNDRDAMGRIANEIAKDPITWKQAQNARLNEKIAYIDDLNRRQSRRLADEIYEARAQYGEHPELLIREAIAEIERSNPEAAAAALNRASPASIGRFDPLLTEINARLPKANAANRSDLLACAKAFEWKASGHLQPGDDVFVVAGSKGLALEARLIGAPRGTALSKSGDLRNAPIYVQDTPSLNNLDWSAAPKAAVDYVLSRDLGTVFKLPRSDLAHYRPRTIVSAGRSYRNSSSSQANSAVSSAENSARVSFSVWTQNTGQDNEEDEEEDFVYLVSANTSST